MRVLTYDQVIKWQIDAEKVDDSYLCFQIVREVSKGSHYTLFDVMARSGHYCQVSIPNDEVSSLSKVCSA